MRYSITLQLYKTGGLTQSKTVGKKVNSRYADLSRDSKL